ncbi:3-oxoacyl-[acyl-carrier-protein] synthase [Savitreella phatthalungensis]
MSLSAEVEQELAHTVLIELLAYQFASPVRWIETQDVLLGDRNAERVVEIGPSPTLSGMAQRTLKQKYEAYDAAKSIQRDVLCYSSDAKSIYYNIEDPAPQAQASEPAAESAKPAAAAPTPAVTAAPVPAPAPSAAAEAVPDEPVKAVDVVHALVAQKLKKSLDDVPLSKAIKDLVGGKSTMQNEILGDLGKEFGSTPEKPEDTPLDELGAAMQGSFSGQLGKQSSSLVQRLYSAKMPAGFNITSVRSHLSARWGLGPGRTESVLLMSLTMEPAARLGSEADAKAFLDSVAQKYAAKAGVTLGQPAGGASGSGGGGGAGLDPEQFKALTKEQTDLARSQLSLYAKYLKIDLRAGDRKLVDEKLATQALQEQLDLWETEHGDFYATGIKPSFSALKARVYDSHWNWARQDALHMYFDIVFGRLKLVDREIVARCISLMNRSNPTLLDFIQYHIDHCPTERSETYLRAQELAKLLLQNCQESLHAAPVYKDVTYPTGPQTSIDAKGNMSFSEVPRPNVRKFEQYVAEMAAGGKSKGENPKKSIQHDLSRIYRIIRQQNKMSKSSRLQIKSLYADVVQALSSDSSSGRGSRKLNLNIRETIPFLHLKRKEDHGWEYDSELTKVYLDGLSAGAKEGITFEHKHVLMTGCGAGSIGAEVMQGLLAGGAKVIVTTSRYSKSVTEFYQQTFARHGSRGAALIVVPFNQGSKQDVDELVNYIYDDKHGLGWDLDFIIPFAAIPENGREIDNIDSRSELAHRIMLTNLLRLIGAVKMQKAQRGFDTRPAQVMLPLSPNHGTFGNDGLYSESKLALETLFNRWYSESWAAYLTITGLVIGWTRGTGLMSGNNSVAEGIEKYGVRTFSQQEMAFNILGLMTPAIVLLCQQEPVWADLNGGLQLLPNLKDLTSRMRKELAATSDTRQAVAAESAIEHQIVNGPDAEQLHKKHVIQPRANMRFEFPQIKSAKELSALKLQGMVDLDKVAVVTGFSEVGPWGNSRTRWEMEAYGAFSLEGCIEMAWIMGLINNKNGSWVDAKSGQPVDDKDVKAKYEQQILDHAGIRLIEPELFEGYDPHKKQLLQEVVLEQDMEPFDTSAETAAAYKHEHGDKVDVFENADGEWTVILKRGATLLIPKALRFDRFVAGQIPTGWDPKRYGLEDDIISQVDPITLYVLVSTVEALVSSGITDPYEFYQYVHVSEVGNTAGSGIGGVTALRGMYKDRWIDKPVQKDILQESFINTMSAWVNMLLLSSAGPIKTPVGACATAAESVEIGLDTIVSGKAKIVIVGGYDDFQEEGSYEFANMGATSNAEKEIARGRTPGEMSRPTTTTRNGFMESQGAGIQILMQGSLAVKMGVPIYGVIAMTATATDKEGRSVPAPGQGILTTARETPGKFPSPLLNLDYRAKQLARRRREIAAWSESEYGFLEDEIRAMQSQQADYDVKTYRTERANHIHREVERQAKAAQSSYGNDFYKGDASIAPLRGALAVWGLTVDDIGVASFHGTSTVANDKNESETISKQLAHLGRKKGNALLGIFQKYLTGHPKGAAAAWMLNGAMQVLNTGFVPGNRNADNVDQHLERFSHILYPSRGIQTDGIKAASVTSFGFGQVGAQIIVIHPDYVLATLEPSVLEAYRSKVESRYRKSYRYWHESMANQTLIKAKKAAPYTAAQESAVYLDPLARAVPDKAGSWSFAKSFHTPARGHTEDLLAGLALSSGAQNVGVDVELISSLPVDNETFIERNFTQNERDYCSAAASPQSSFAGTWSAKEAVFKSLGVSSKGAGASLIDIEIVRSSSSTGPQVALHGAAKAAAEAAGIREVKVSISHDDVQAVAVAIAQ